MTIAESAVVSIRSRSRPASDQSNIHPGDYTGPAACGQCHKKNYDAWSAHPHRWMNALVDAVAFMRRINARNPKKFVREIQPGPEITDGSPELAEWVRTQAWGHHASCTCPIGAKEKGGVLNSDFRVHGTEGLRVVDASVFPRIPGYFIASAVYMVGEKAADVILTDAK